MFVTVKAVSNRDIVLMKAVYYSDNIGTIYSLLRCTRLLGHMVQINFDPDNGLIGETFSPTSSNPMIIGNKKMNEYPKLNLCVNKILLFLRPCKGSKATKFTYPIVHVHITSVPIKIQKKSY